MAGRYGPVGQVDHINHDHDGTRDEYMYPSPFHTDCVSPLSNTTSATMASPSSSTYVTLADQTFTPLSMGSSDYCISDHEDGNNNSDINEWATTARGNSASDVEQNNNLKVLRPKRALLRRFEGGIGRSWITDNNHTSSKSVGIGAVSSADSGLAQAQGQAQALSAPSAGNRATIVSTMVQSFEGLQPAGAPVGYDLISTKNTHHRKNPNFGLVSPPLTVSPSPTPSLSSSPVAHDAPQRLSRVLNTNSTGRDIVVTAHYAIRPGSGAQAKSPDASGQDNKQENPELLPPAQHPSAPRDTSISSNPSTTNAKTHTLPALSIPPCTSSVADFATSSVSAGGTAIARPTAERPPSHTPRTASPSPTNPLFRTSSTASLTISHPTPDLSKQSRSGAYLGNIAALEATAERLSTTSSIDIAIREELDELKRSDSRRSSILRTSSERSVSRLDCASLLGQPQSSVASRQNSILGTNNVARLGGYSPGGFIMSPHSSVSGAAPLRLRSASKASSFNVPSPIAGNVPIDNWGGEDSLFMARHGPGKSSVRSTVSRASLGLISELDQPSALTKEAFDAADRVAAIGEDAEDDDTIRASAHQYIEPEFANVLEEVSSPQTEVLLPVLDSGFMENGFGGNTSPRLQLHQPAEYAPYRENLAVQDDDRPTTSGSNMTYEAQRAFGDFDGVHCEPEFGEEFPQPQVPRFQEPGSDFPPQAPRASRQLDQPPPRPKSYFDQYTGQQMLFYPAPVPAMLNLPPKLSRKSKAETSARNIRRSQILSAMPQAQAMPQATSQPVRESRVWLPDPMEGVNNSRDNLPFMTGLLGDDLGPATPETDPAPQLPDSGATGHRHGESSHARQASETSTIHAPPPPPAHQQHQGLQVPQQREIRRPQKITEANKRNTRATMLEDLPPQLRASAFFDLPPTVPKIEVKGGSAMATLDSILDASASAPVSAFTDHVFAGKLGAEVYGAEKKKKKKAKKALAVDGQEADNRKTIIARDSSTDLLNGPRKPNKLRKRPSQLSLMGLDPEQDGDLDAADGRTTVGLVAGEEGARRKSNMNRDGSSPDSEREPISPNELAPDSDEDSDSDDEESSDEDDDDVYRGAPTTLLAELQLRKQQNKMRTKPKYNAHSNGLHTTLLELDAVAEVERKARKGKRINLAWEDPNANPDHLEDMDDDEVPLGMLFAAKAAGNTPSTMDISAVMNEVNRPLGLMERRELEDNEPLSQRRDRLQGRSGGMMPMSLGMMQKRMTQLSLAPYGGGPNGLAGTLAGNRSQSRLGLPYSPSVMGGSKPGSVIGEPVGDEGEVEGETLAQRKARLAAENPLPRTRPVSGMFSSELLSHFGGDDESKDDPKNKKEAGADNVPEEEETLGQRRKRLQGEREAREREMNSGGGGLGSALNLALPSNPNRNTMLSVADAIEGPGYHLPHQMSMSNMLAAHPLDSAQGRFDPRNGDRLRKDADAERLQMMEKDAKMAALRAQMPTTLDRVSVGARNGGYMGGKFNNGSGGNPLQPRVPTVMGNPINTAAGMPDGYVAPLGSGVPVNVNPAAAYAGMPMPAQMMPLAGGGIQQGQPVDMVERWRQSVMP